MAPTVASVNTEQGEPPGVGVLVEVVEPVKGNDGVYVGHGAPSSSFV
jgi:hypothetical protein